MSTTYRSQVSAPLEANGQQPVRLEGESFDVALSRFSQGDRVEGGLSSLGEEVGAVLEGTFEVAAAGEHYSLSAGEGIVIPPEEARCWTCTSPHGVLYRVIVKLGKEGRPE